MDVSAQEKWKAWAKKQIDMVLKSNYGDKAGAYEQTLKGLGFFEAPASTMHSHHSAYPGGLAVHSAIVSELVMRIGNVLLPMSGDLGRWAFVALLHDVSKTGYEGKPHYVENTLKSGKPSDSKPYERSGDLCPTGDGIRSVAIISRLLTNLSASETQAVAYHAGMYEAGTREISGSEHPFMLILHWADMWAARFMEKDLPPWLESSIMAEISILAVNMLQMYPGDVVAPSPVE